MSGETTARELALMALERFRRDGKNADEILDRLIKQHSPDARESALGSRIFYVTLQNLYLCDFHIGAYSSVKPRKLEPKVLDILRISVSQILFFDKVPDYAVADAAVNLCRKLRYQRAAGLVNAVLRRVAADKGRLPSGHGTVEYLSVRYSTPLWLVNEYVNRIGSEETEKLLEANNAETPITAQVNLLKTDTENLLRLLLDAEISVVEHPWLQDAVELKSAGNVTELPGFTDGLFYIQDAAARLTVIAAGIQPGQRVLDVCAAPGGKSFAAAVDMRDRGEVVSCDISESRLRRVRSGAEMLGISIITTRQMDARAPDAEFVDGFDAVIADVPCSGLGVIRKKPDIRYKEPTEFDGLPETQLEILEGAARCVKSGGVLVYSTCTTRQEENESVVSAFLEKNDRFVLEDFWLSNLQKSNTGDFWLSNLQKNGNEDFGLLDEPKNGMITLWPQRHGTDGFFICKMRKKI